MRIAGLDVGDKTIGVAVSDPLDLTAQGVGVVRRRGGAADFSELRRLLAPYPVERLVVGLPRNMNGTFGPRAALVQEFAVALEKNLGLPVEFWDERLTTRAAEQVLLAADVSRRRRRQVIDKMAAVLILQGYLDRQRNPSHSG